METTMQVSEIMTRRVETAAPDDSIEQVARRMAEADVGAMPVCDGRSIQGMVTDRDIVVRGLAQGLDRTARVRDVMTAHVESVRESDDLDEVHDRMSAAQVRRLPVVNDAGELVGIVALADVALIDDEEEAGETLEEISEPTGARPA
jgi:CBS domain-containing protein